MLIIVVNCILRLFSLAHSLGQTPTIGIQGVRRAPAREGRSD
jgi:hypothetical protein